MLGQSTPVKSFPSHAINDPKIVDTRADRQLMTREHYYSVHLLIVFTGTMFFKWGACHTTDSLSHPNFKMFK